MSNPPPQPRDVQPRSWTRRTFRWLFLFVVVPYVAIVTLFTLNQRSLIYHPSRVASLSAESARDVTLTTDDGLQLHGWLLSEHPHDTRLPNETPPLLIYFPGNAQHRGVRRHDLQEFARLGFDVLIFDYRGYGENPGSPSEPAMKADARLVWQFAIDELMKTPERIVIYGESLGGAVATNLAAEMCEQSTPPAALITNASFASLAGTVAWHYPWAPFRYLLWDHWPSHERMPHVTCPVLMFHGVQDDIVPLSQGQELFASASDVSAIDIPKSFVVLPHSGHNDIPVSTLRYEIESLTDTVFAGTMVEHALDGE